MSFFSQLTVSEKDYNVRSFLLLSQRLTDKKGSPSSKPAWTLFIVIDASEDDEIIDWMIDPYKKIDGELTLYNTDEDSILKKITFKKTLCSGLKECFFEDKALPITWTLTLSGESISVGEMELYN